MQKRNLGNIMKNFFKNLFFLLKNDFDLIIFSEGIQYQKIYSEIVKILSTKKIKILYVTLDSNEKLNLENITILNFGKSVFRLILYHMLKGKILLTTTPDIGNNEIPITKKVKDYFYIFHSAASAHKLYNKNAFDNFNVIMVNGDYQIDELKKIEIFNNSQKKRYLKTGYIYFDYLNKNKLIDASNLEPENILFAPSWNKNKNNLTTTLGDRLIENLLKSNLKVIFRPHPEQVKRENKKINSILNTFKNNKNFIFDTSNSNLKSLTRSKLLITDNSAIAIEFNLIFQKPVIYINHEDKINNQDHKLLNVKNLELEVKKKFGYAIEYENNNFENIKDLINNAELDFIKKKNELNEFLKKNFYNYGNVAEVASQQIIDHLSK
tara:strand:+ start:659 stop:1798 length:1140 start_codon:yes stop_codon:yes gene_type:complete